MKYILWDASAVIAYYVPELAATAKAAERVENLVQSLRHHRFNGFFYIPNVVVAETFVTFDRYHYSTWDRKVNKKFGAPGRSLHAVRYRSARSRFRRDIHNGALFYQCDLNRYHILGLDLISPVDKHRKFYRKPSVSSMGTFDLLIGAMALHFTKIHGPDNFALLTTDRRMQAIFDQTCRTLPASTARGLGLEKAAAELGFGGWSGSIYPHVIDIARSSDVKLAEWFGSWPLETRKPRNRPPRA